TTSYQFLSKVRAKQLGEQSSIFITVYFPNAAPLRLLTSALKSFHPKSKIFLAFGVDKWQ
ncbi:MAG: hypothetical protein ACKO2Z_24660, partial [Sphaerospermopsis kisseleviana]